MRNVLDRKRFLPCYVSVFIICKWCHLIKVQKKSIPRRHILLFSSDVLKSFYTYTYTFNSVLVIDKGYVQLLELRVSSLEAIHYQELCDWL